MFKVGDKIYIDHQAESSISNRETGHELGTLTEISHSLLTYEPIIKK